MKHAACDYSQKIYRLLLHLYFTIYLLSYLLANILNICSIWNESSIDESRKISLKPIVIETTRYALFLAFLTHNHINLLLEENIT